MGIHDVADGHPVTHDGTDPADELRVGVGEPLDDHGSVLGEQDAVERALGLELRELRASDAIEGGDGPGARGVGGGEADGHDVHARQGVGIAVARHGDAGVAVDLPHLLAQQVAVRAADGALGERHIVGRGGREGVGLVQDAERGESHRVASSAGEMMRLPQVSGTAW